MLPIERGREKEVVLKELWTDPKLQRRHVFSPAYKEMTRLKDFYVEKTTVKAGYQESSGKKYYITGCVFTYTYTEISKKIMQYMKDRGDIEIIRCCGPNYRLEEHIHKMPEYYRDEWLTMPDTAKFAPGDTVYAICPNCICLTEETKPAVNITSLWETILEDENFVYPDYSGRSVVLQDCWRTRHRREEQDAVRQILRNMHIEYRELDKCREKADFCGVTLYKPNNDRNMAWAPKHFVYGAEDKFIPHTEEEQTAIMQEYCRQFDGEEVVCYCHYCHTGLKRGGANSVHLAELLFADR